jgi:hypothetical protein
MPFTGFPADSLYQHLLLTAEKKFWRCVETGEPPRLFGVEPPAPASRLSGWWIERLEQLGRIRGYLSADPRSLH